MTVNVRMFERAFEHTEEICMSKSYWVIDKPSSVSLRVPASTANVNGNIGAGKPEATPTVTLDLAQDPVCKVLMCKSETTSAEPMQNQFLEMWASVWRSGIWRLGSEPLYLFLPLLWAQHQVPLDLFCMFKKYTSSLCCPESHEDRAVKGCWNLWGR